MRILRFYFIMKTSLRLFLVVLLLLFVPAFSITRASAQDFATQTVNATYKLFNNASTATGFFIRPTPEAAAKNVILVTAAHVLSKMSGDTAIVVLRQRQTDGSYRRRDWNIKIRQDNKPLWATHPDQDVAALRVQLPEDAEVIALPLSALATEKDLIESKLHIASSLLVLGFPTQFEANGAGFPIARHGSVASFPLTPVGPHKTFIADFATFVGDSGGPVFIEDKRQNGEAPPLIIGLVLAQFRHDEKIETLNEERTIHHSLQLSTIQHAQFIRDTIEHLP